MASTTALLNELEGIQLATLRAEQRRRIETMILSLAAVVSAARMVAKNDPEPSRGLLHPEYKEIGLAHIYISLAGLR